MPTKRRASASPAAPSIPAKSRHLAGKNSEKQKFQDLYRLAPCHAAAGASGGPFLALLAAAPRTRCAISRRLVISSASALSLFARSAKATALASEIRAPLLFAT